MNKGSIAETLVDLTGGSCDKISLKTDKVKSAINSGFLWDEIVSFHTKDYVMGCSVSDNTAITEVGEGTFGLMKNVAYPILDVKEVQASTGLMKVRSGEGRGGAKRGAEKARVRRYRRTSPILPYAKSPSN